MGLAGSQAPATLSQLSRPRFQPAQESWESPIDSDLTQLQQEVLANIEFKLDNQFLRTNASSVQLTRIECYFPADNVLMERVVRFGLSKLNDFVVTDRALKSQK